MPKKVSSLTKSSKFNPLLAITIAVMAVVVGVIAVQLSSAASITKTRPTAYTGKIGAYGTAGSYCYSLNIKNEAQPAGGVGKVIDFDKPDRWVTWNDASMKRTYDLTFSTVGRGDCGLTATQTTIGKSSWSENYSETTVKDAYGNPIDEAHRQYVCGPGTKPVQLESGNVWTCTPN
jgi:hypothetical protein